MRASRLLGMLMLLQMRRRMTAEALAGEFEVSVRTIYRDIDHLSAAGVPVYADRGRTGGFRLLEGFETRLTGLTSQEAETLLLAGLEGPAASLGIGGPLLNAQRKMLAALPEDKRASARRIATRFHFDPVAWYRRAESTDHLPAVARAVWEERIIRVRYESWRRLIDRTLAPLGLALKSGRWYVVALADGAPRTYRVSSIRELEVLQERFRRPPDFDLAAFWREWVRDFEARIYRDRAIVRASPLGIARLRDLSAAVADAIDASRTPVKPKGWMRVELPIETIEHAQRELMGLGMEVEVLAPKALRERIGRTAERLARLYARRPG
ncbi:MAG TPA: WYL domain-containing protein [Steroidobacteraceae bacterium]|nr:WYL domain-containing protein [Steroidobacteraceae bacterium]